MSHTYGNVLLTRLAWPPTLRWGGTSHAHGLLLNSYLTIAQEALRLVRRPLTSREIIEVAYRHDLVPPRLYGKTQHKTFGARLSEDILALRDRSLFYRSEPGRFFLREYLDDPSVPDAYKTPIVARRRERELRRGTPLAISEDAAVASSSGSEAPRETLSAIAETGGFRYLTNSERAHEGALQVWSYVIFIRGTEVLTYRHGRYREGRDSFLRRRSIGFFTPVSDRDRDLFNDGDYGIGISGLRAIAFDLDLPPTVFGDSFRSKVFLSSIVLASDDSGKRDLLAVVDMECPPHFEPLTRRLAINDLAWLPLDRPINHIEDFDPWSRAVMARRGVGQFQHMAAT